MVRYDPDTAESRESVVAAMAAALEGQGFKGWDMATETRVKGADKPSAPDPERP